jgi:plasmid maintenance system antidote protein VapI
MNTTILPQDIIAKAFEERKQRNPNYSLRAFARDVGISAAQLSRILRGQREISTEQACKIAFSLKLSPHLFVMFIAPTIKF